MKARDLTPFAVKLRELRNRARLSQPQLAELTGLSRGYIGGIEAGHRGKRPSRDVIITLARALDVPPAELLAAADRDTPADREVKPARLTFQQVVTGDHLLRTDEKQLLIQLYESYVGRRRPAPR